MCLTNISTLTLFFHEFSALDKIRVPAISHEPYGIDS